MPIAIASWKVHLSELTAVAQCRVDQTRALEDLRPIERGYETHARDYVSDGNVGPDLPLMLRSNHVVATCPCGREAFLQPGYRRCHVWILITHAFEQSHHERWRQRHGVEAQKRGLRRDCLPTADTKKLVSQRVSLCTGCTGIDDLIGGAAQVFDEHDSECNRDRPKLTNI